MLSNENFRKEKLRDLKSLVFPKGGPPIEPLYKHYVDVLLNQSFAPELEKKTVDFLFENRLQLLLQEVLEKTLSLVNNSLNDSIIELYALQTDTDAEGFAKSIETLEGHLRCVCTKFAVDILLV
eukprot:TRINITY_DN4549_c0_g1_i1.p1 TRINITY_DN4549_c0_g1~~TRINITY_DN4549_c0_g1_i1.p1  ORF type:complete len:124 (-),score=26.08 TRINITY_DN4549_c0_g1_i1:22-393(-)